MFCEKFIVSHYFLAKKVLITRRKYGEDTLETGRSTRGDTNEGVMGVWQLRVICIFGKVNEIYTHVSNKSIQKIVSPFDNL
jgi:hypothetical protein